MTFANLSKFRQACRPTGGSQPRPFSFSTYEQVVYPDEPLKDHCGCRGFSFRRDCKHLKEAREAIQRDAVCWIEGVSSEKQDLQQQFDMTCPRCHGPTMMEETPQ